MSRYGRLVCLSGPNAGQEVELSREMTAVGRSAEAGIRLEDQFASRQHAEILRVGTGYQVRDLQSKNGVVVDGQRLAPGATAWLSDGVEVQFASTRYRFHDPSATVTAPSLIAVSEPGLRVDFTTRQVYVDGTVYNDPTPPPHERD